MMKLPFHTTAKSTARLLMSIPSYWYCGERGREHTAREAPYHGGVRDAAGTLGDRDYSGRETGGSSSLWAEKGAEGESGKPPLLFD